MWPCYQEAFGDFDDFGTWRTDLFGRHAARDGYRLAVAADGPVVAGFSWGYTGQRGQYWAALHDTLLEGITRRCLLSTADPAVRLYLDSGWRRLGLLRPDGQVLAD